MKKENFVADVKEAIDVALFKHSAMNHVAGSKQKNISAILIIAASAVFSIIGMNLFTPFSPSLMNSLGMIISHTIMTIVSIYVLSIVAKSIFKGHAKHDAFFRAMAFASIVGWLTIFPPVGIIAGFWGVALVFVVLKVVHKLTTGGALGAILVALIALGFLHMLLAPTFGKLGFNPGFRGGSFEDYYENGFKMNFKSEEGAGSVHMEDGVMRIEGPDGEMMEIEIPGT